jgi:hypothetical protein
MNKSCKRLLNLNEKLLEGKIEVAHQMIYFVSFAGNVRHCYLTAVLLRDQLGAPTYAGVFLMDLTDKPDSGGSFPETLLSCAALSEAAAMISNLQPPGRMPSAEVLTPPVQADSTGLTNVESAPGLAPYQWQQPGSSASSDASEECDVHWGDDVVPMDYCPFDVFGEGSSGSSLSLDSSQSEGDSTGSLSSAAQPRKPRKRRRKTRHPWDPHKWTLPRNIRPI